MKYSTFGIQNLKRTKHSVVDKIERIKVTLDQKRWFFDKHFAEICKDLCNMFQVLMRKMFLIETILSWNFELSVHRIGQQLPMYGLCCVSFFCVYFNTFHVCHEKCKIFAKYNIIFANLIWIIQQKPRHQNMSEYYKIMIEPTLKHNSLAVN